MAPVPEPVGGAIPMTAIKFGTDGWRGVIDEDFTEANAATVVQAAAETWAADADRGRPIVVGYDTRRNSRAVAELAADILAANGWRTLLADRPVPTPLVSFSVVRHRAVGGLVITASHNPARFNGIKLKAPFGGLHPEPIPPHIDGLAAEVRMIGADVGVAMDGDGDRLGVVASDGRWITPHEVLALLTRHLVEVRGWRGEVVKGFAVGVQVDRVCARYGLPLHVTAIGFKHIATLMQSRDILIGGEESGGVGFRDHLPERDGLLSALFVLEAVVASGTSLDDLIRSLEAEAGAAVYRRRDYTLHPDLGRRLVARLDAEPPERLGSRRVARVETLDGRKYWLDDGAWVLVRPSGTEPLLRIYIEAPTAAEVEDLHAVTEALVERLTKEHEAR